MEFNPSVVINTQYTSAVVPVPRLKHPCLENIWVEYIQSTWKYFLNWLRAFAKSWTFNPQAPFSVTDPAALPEASFSSTTVIAIDWIASPRFNQNLCQSELLEVTIWADYSHAESCHRTPEPADRIKFIFLIVPSRPCTLNSYYLFCPSSALFTLYYFPNILVHVSSLSLYDISSIWSVLSLFKFSIKRLSSKSQARGHSAGNPFPKPKAVQAYTACPWHRGQC